MRGKIGALALAVLVLLTAVPMGQAAARPMNASERSIARRASAHWRYVLHQRFPQSVIVETGWCYGPSPYLCDSPISEHGNLLGFWKSTVTSRYGQLSYTHPQFKRAS